MSREGEVWSGHSTRESTAGTWGRWSPGQGQDLGQTPSHPQEEPALLTPSSQSAGFQNREEVNWEFQLPQAVQMWERANPDEQVWSG